MPKTTITILSLIIAMLVGCAGPTDGLNEKEFAQRWTVESESPEYCVDFKDGYCEIVSPMGLTLWYNEEMHGDVVIEYDATVFEEREGDRLSDLNCFWMASDPKTGNVLDSKDERGGVFRNCASMQLYYVGFGGNYNSTTRFRRYDGQPNPAIIGEYSDPEHLLKPNHWYHIKLVSEGDKVQYWIDGELLFDYADESPYKSGRFGFRTTLSRTGIRNFHYSENKQ